MRSFEEVTSEVFKRSEQRITARKRRRKWALSAVATAASVIICVGVFAWSPWSGISDDRTTDNITEENVESTVTQSMAELTEDSVAKHVYVSLKVVSSPFADESEGISDDPEKIGQIADRLKSLCESDADDSELKDFQSSAPSATDSTVEHKIILTSFDGSETVYLLIGNTLYGDVNGSPVTLTATELQELRDLLGI